MTAMDDKTTVYVAMINDRHSDTEPYVFLTADEAIKTATIIMICTAGGCQ